MGRDQVEEEAGECVSRKDQKDLETDGTAARNTTKA